MDSLLEPLAALLVILIPLGLAYFLVGLESRSKGKGKRKGLFKRRCAEPPAR
jgi:hypothetical protein